MFIIDREALTAKFCLAPVVLAHNLGFSATELRRLERLVSVNRAQLLERWDYEYGNIAR
jgi:hypothetical protein